MHTLAATFEGKRSDYLCNGDAKPCNVLGKHRHTGDLCLHHGGCLVVSRNLTLVRVIQSQKVGGQLANQNLETHIIRQTVNYTMETRCNTA